MYKKIVFVLMLICCTLAVGIGPVQGQEPLPDGYDQPIELDPSLSSTPGFIIGEGSYFEITDSDYLNINLKTNEPIKAMMESAPEMVVICLETAGDTTFVTAEFGGFLPETTYYLYMGEHKSGNPILTDINGFFTIELDLSQPQTFLIQPHPGTKFIPSNSSVGVWNETSRTYTLTQDVTDSLYIEEGNLILDGNGFTITGPSNLNGINLAYKNNVTIKNLNIQGFHYGIYGYRSTFTMKNNSIKDTSSNGVAIYYSNNIVFEDNTIQNSHLRGAYLFGSSGNSIKGNLIKASNYDGFYGISVNDSSVEDNTIESNNKIGGYAGLYISNSINNLIKNNIVNDNDRGIYLRSSSGGNVLDSNLLKSNYSTNIALAYSHNNVIIRNTMLDLIGDWGSGLQASRSYDNSIVCNASVNNPWGIRVDSYSGRNLIEGNSISGSIRAGSLIQGTSNILKRNTLENNNSGLLITQNSELNLIYHNNFLGNRLQASDHSTGTNSYNLNLPVGGNHFSDWTSPDFNRDGIVDNPYTLYLTGQDNLPWVEKFSWAAKAEASPQMGTVDSAFTFDGSTSYDTNHEMNYEWDFGDGNTATGVNVSHTFDNPGVYEVTLTVRDDMCYESTDSIRVVAYVPEGGFVTGGGWIWSRAGTYAPEPNVTGWANFGFVAKYHKGAEVPDGQAELVYHTAGMNFHSTEYDWLVVTGGDTAKFKGRGTINGEGDYKFMIWAGDGDPDTFRIKIWEETNGEELVVYDNSRGYSDYENGQPIGKGSIIVHDPKIKPISAQCVTDWINHHMDTFATYELEVDRDTLGGFVLDIYTWERYDDSLSVKVTSLTTGSQWSFTQPACGTMCSYSLYFYGPYGHSIGEGSGTYQIEIRQAEEGDVMLRCAD